MNSSQNNKKNFILKRSSKLNDTFKNSIKKEDYEKMNENYEKEYNLDNISKDIEIKNYMSNKENFKSSSYQIENIKQEDETKTSAKKRFYFSELGGNNNKNDLLQIKEKIRLQDKDNSIGVLKSPDSYSNLVNSKAIKEIKPETSNILKSNVQNSC